MFNSAYNPNSAMKKYLAIASALLLIFTVAMPPLGVSFAIFNLIFLTIWYLMKSTKLSEKNRKIILWGIGISNVFLFLYLRLQSFIPFWDYAGYYIETLRTGALMEENIPEFFMQLYHSMLNSDYTLLPTMFIAPILRVLGGSYTVYIFVIFNCFIVPFFVIFGVLIHEVNSKCVPLLFLFTPFISPMLRGYLDGAGLMYTAVWLYLIYEKTFRKPAVLQDILIGILSVLLIFTRRWYLFFVVGTYLAILLAGAVRWLYDRDYDLKAVARNLMISGGTTLTIVAIFFFPYLKRLVTNNMAEAYSAYMFGDFWWNIKYFIRYYGFLPMVFCALGLFGLRRRRYRQFTIFLLFQIPVMFLLFTRIQTVSYHHQYLFAPSIFLLMIIGISSLPKWNKPAMIAFATTLAVAFAYIYIPTPTDFLRNVFSNKQFAPKTMETEGIVRLRDRVNELTAAEENAYVYVLASSETLNDDILKNSLLPETEQAVPNLLGTNHVDKRDGLPNHLLVSRYIVVTDPVQVHLGAENQQVVDFFAREILDGTYTPNLERIESVQITDKVTAHIYRRNSGYTEEFLNRVQNHFNALYPETETLFSVDFVYSQNS